MARRHADGTLYRVIVSGEFPSGQGWTQTLGPYLKLATAKGVATRVTEDHYSTNVVARIESSDPTWTAVD